MLDLAHDILGNPWLHKAFWTMVLGAATLLAAKLAARGVSRLLHQDSNPLPTSSIIVNIVRAIIWIMGASVILDTIFNVNTSSIIAALGVGGIAVSLGFQDTLANLIGGLQVTFMGIVKPGDNIEVGSETGVVQDVSWRHTTIRDALGQTVIIPNSIISTTALVRVHRRGGGRRHRRVSRSALGKGALSALRRSLRRVPYRNGGLDHSL